MTIQPLLDAPLAVQIHVATVLPAALIGAVVLFSRKGTPIHRLLGRLWFALMVTTSLSTFFIHSFDLFYGFSPIHLISLYVIYQSVTAIRAARSGNIRAHRSAVIGMYFGGIVVAGLLSLVPGRMMHAVVFSDGMAWILPAAVIAIAAAFIFRKQFFMRGF